MAGYFYIEGQRLEVETAKLASQLTASQTASQTAAPSKSSADPAPNNYINSDGLIAALSKAGITANYGGDIVISAKAIGLSTDGMVNALAVITESDLSDCEMRLASYAAATYLREKDFRHVYNVLLVKTKISGKQIPPDNAVCGWSAQPQCS